MSFDEISDYLNQTDELTNFIRFVIMHRTLIQLLHN